MKIKKQEPMVVEIKFKPEMPEVKFKGKPNLMLEDLKKKPTVNKAMLEKLYAGLRSDSLLTRDEAIECIDFIFTKTFPNVPKRKYN